MDWRDAMARFEVERQTATLMDTCLSSLAKKAIPKYCAGRTCDRRRSRSYRGPAAQQACTT